MDGPLTLTSTIDHPLRFESLEEHRPAALADLMNLAFSDYLAGPAHMDGSQMEAFLQAGAVDRSQSLLAMDGDTPVGLALVGRRGPDWRIATMGILPEKRRAGLGRRMLKHLIEAITREGGHRLHLEVFEQNKPALGLYRSLGFQPCRRLRGWRQEAKVPAHEPGAQASELALPVLLEEEQGLDFPTLPWQCSPWGASLMPFPQHCQGNADLAVAILGFQSQKPILRSVFSQVTTPASKLAGLLLALRRKHPDKQWSAPAIWPEEFDFAFRQAGFQQEPLNQLQMALDLG